MTTTGDDGTTVYERSVASQDWQDDGLVDERMRADADSLDPIPKTSQQKDRDLVERDYAFKTHVTAIEQLDAWLRTRCMNERLVQRILACGTEAWVECSPSTGRYRVRANRCGSRVCPRCRVPWGLKQQEKIVSAVADVPEERRKLATFTLKSTSAPLRMQVKRLWKCFERLKNRSLWRWNVRGSIAVLEITYNVERGQWHPHLHVVLDACWIDQKLLSQTWLAVTRDSKIVDIRAIRSFDSMATYLVKYLLKAIILPVGVNPVHTDELYDLYNGSKFVRFAGTLRPRPGEELYRNDYPTDWTPCMRLHTYLNRLGNDDGKALQIALALTDEPGFWRANPFDPTDSS